jgi:hypothetical protein
MARPASSDLAVFGVLLAGIAVFTAATVLLGPRL